MSGLTYVEIDQPADPPDRCDRCSAVALWVEVVNGEATQRLFCDACRTRDLNSPEAIIREVDPLVVEEFAESGMATPAVHLFAQPDGADRYAVNVLPLFQAADPREAARKKQALIPTVRDYIAKRSLDILGYVFVCQGFSADPEDERTRAELAKGKPVARLSTRVPVILYCAEMWHPVSGSGGMILRAYGEREIQASPRALLDLAVRQLDRSPNRIGFGVLGDGSPEELPTRTMPKRRKPW